MGDAIPPCSVPLTARAGFRQLLQEEQSEGPLARTACWGPQALEVLSPGLWCQGWLLPPAPSGHPLHAGVLWGSGGDTQGDRASNE